MSQTGSTQLELGTYKIGNRDEDDTTGHRTAPETANQRDRPENIPELESECCWHCHNPVSQMHVLSCQSCSYVLRSPAVQNHATCTQCGDRMECIRYTWRLVAPKDRDGDATGFGKRCYHPRTGEQKPAESLRAEGFK